MKLCGVDIPDDIEIPPLDPASKLELDELHETIIRRRIEMQRRKETYKNDPTMPEIKYSPMPPDANKPLTFSINGLRQLSPWARARVLYVMRDQVTP
ncbi:hypothetical protein [Duganella levis]|uniref:Uncharacterized protein n=1 Tax=Duganella levis TaxID=2692169 RepID=A0ABW9W6P4_9BURK|nr:hypothetical protein [Duganella levis]MYN29581.1 hypothetical protein [Duganella levis]